MLSCLIGTFCRSSNLGELEAACKDCKRLAEETAGLCNYLEEKMTSLVSFTQDVNIMWNQIQAGKLSAATYSQLQDLLSDQKLSMALDVAMDMDDVAVECANKTKAMTEVMKRAIDCLPLPVKEELEEEQKDRAGETDDSHSHETEDHERDILEGLNQDIRDIQSCTQAIHKMSIFTAATSGQQALEGLLKRVEIIPLVLVKIKELTATIATLSSAFYVSELNCCVAFQAIAYEAKGIFKSLRLSLFVQQLAIAMQRLINAARRLLEATSRKVPILSREFESAKTIQNFIKVIEHPLAGFRKDHYESDGATDTYNQDTDYSSDDDSSNFVRKLFCQ